MKKIALLAFDTAPTGPLAITLDALAIAESLAGHHLFDVHRLGFLPGGGVARTNAKARELADGGFDAVVLPGLGVGYSQAPEALTEGAQGMRVANALAAAHGSGAIIAASCAATFLVATAGLLKDKQATTSWWLAGAFRTRFPDVHLDENRLVTQNGRVICAGGTLAHVELLEHLMVDLVGTTLADQVSRYLVSPGRGSQAAMARVEGVRVQDAAVERAIAYLKNHYRRQVSIADCAEAAHVSTRTLDRKIRGTFGLSPIGLLQRIRVEAAVDALKKTSRAFKAIALDVGYEDEHSLRQLIVRHTGMTPATIRESAKGWTLDA